MKTNRNSDEKDYTYLSTFPALPSEYCFPSRDGSELFWRESAWFLLGQKCDQRKHFLDLEKTREQGKKWNGQRD